jgi:hypothetical protein
MRKRPRSAHLFATQKALCEDGHVRRRELPSRLAEALLPALESGLPAWVKVTFDHRAAMVVLVSTSGGIASAVSFPFLSLRLPLPLRLTAAACGRQVLRDVARFARKVRSTWPNEYSGEAFCTIQGRVLHWGFKSAGEIPHSLESVDLSALL